MNESYLCAENGHVMGAWMIYRGISAKHPRGVYYRICVIPGCKYHEEKEAAKA